MSERAILAAQGYLELGMAEEALAELSSVPTSESTDPDILELRLHILMQVGNWNEALSCSEELIRLMPEDLPAYIHGAFALHELGRTREARDFLQKGPDSLRKDPTFHYNIGCYEAVLGNRGAALRSLNDSFALDQTYRDFARRDPDLALMREDLEE
jgi:tetratricopeptide (TPR) repeat protein